MIDYAKKIYNNPMCSGYDEFFEDFSLRPKYISKLLKRYIITEEINFRLVINHIQTMFNVFDNYAFYILYKYIDDSILPLLKSVFICGDFESSLFDNISCNINLFNKLKKEV